MSDKKYGEGHFLALGMGIGMAVFSGIFVPLGIYLDRIILIAIGPSLGVIFGLAMGKIFENKYIKEGKIKKEK